MMRRMMKAGVCTLVVWFGLFGLGGPALYSGDAASEREVVQASAGMGPIAESGAKPVLIEQISYEPGKPSEGDAFPEAASLSENNKAAAAPQEQEQKQNQKQNEKLLYLTFDDGPSENTKQVLDILKREGIAATFFVLGEQVLKQPEIAKRIVAEGHAIGNHTFNHKYDRLYGSFAEFAGQVMKTDEAIYKTLGIRTTLFRAPGGTYSNFDQGYFDAMAEAGYQVHDWNVDSGDSKRVGVPAAEILSTIKKSKLAATLNVLLHDGKGHAESVKALPAILKYYKSKGYTFVPLTDQVKPIQFNVAKQLKWDRAKVSKPEKQSLIAFSEKLGRNSLLGQAEPNAPSLILHRGEQRLELSKEEYRLRNGSIEVPLLKLSEWVGGITKLDLEHGIIEAYYDGNQVLKLSSQTGKMTVEQSERMAVPVRATLEKFGIIITSVVYNDQQREIWLSA